MTVLAILSPLICTRPDGTTYPGDNPLAGWPLPDSWGTPSNCTAGPTMAEQGLNAAGITGPTKSFADGLAAFVKTLSTFWMNEPSPKVSDGANAVGTAQFIALHLSWVAMVVMAISLVIQAARIAWHQRGMDVAALVSSLIRYVLVVGGGAAFAGLLLVVGDAYSTWIIDLASGGKDFGANLNRLISDPNMLAGVAMVAALVLLSIAIIACIVQLGLMMARSGLIVILVGGWPMSASAAAMGEAGRLQFTQYSGTLLALILYKPAAATIYAGAFSLIGTQGNDAVWSIMSGVVTMFVAIFALKWLLKLCTPVVGPGLEPTGVGRSVGMGAALARR